MANKRGIVVALVAVAVLGIAAIAFYSRTRSPAPAELAVGAIGAADRYRSEQIAKEDVILDVLEHYRDFSYKALTSPD